MLSGLKAAAENVPASAVISLRRPLLISAAVGVVAVVVSIFFGHLQMGILGCIGLALGLTNSRLLQRDVVKVISSENPAKKAIGAMSARRLAFITLIALLFGFFLRPDGLGVFLGLAAYQLINIANTVLPVMKELRQR